MTRSIVAQEVQRLPPSSFAFVMATGIVSIAASLQGHTRLAWVLCIVNLAAYALLWGAMIARLSAYRSEIVGDMTNSARAPGFLTIVAGTCVLGSQVFMLFKREIVKCCVRR
jgi:tellurite resistance protein TehA-like permease